MEPQKILQEKEINHSEPVIYMDKEEALENLMETLEEYEVDFDLSKLSKKELEILFSRYAGCIIDFHLENYHQKRGTFWRTKDILMKHGITEDEIMRAFDFC